MPIEFIEYRLCEHFGWTPEELDRQDAEKVHKFITIMGLENQVRSAEMKAIKHNG